LDVLGGDYAIRTPVLAAAAPDASGVVRGDVVIKRPRRPKLENAWC
jgi:hypothetical protein